MPSCQIAEGAKTEKSLHVDSVNAFVRWVASRKKVPNGLSLCHTFGMTF